MLKVFQGFRTIGEADHLVSLALEKVAQQSPGFIVVFEQEDDVFNGNHKTYPVVCASIGSLTVKVEPIPVLLSACTVPPCASTIRLVIQRPIPSPALSESGATRSNSSKIRGRSCAEIPIPLSLIVIVACPSLAVAAMEIGLSPPYLTAFETRFVSTWSILLLSHEPRISGSISTDIEAPGCSALNLDAISATTSERFRYSR